MFSFYSLFFFNRFVKSNDGHTAPGAFLPNSSDDSKNAANEDLVRDGATQTGKLLPEMDIFSAGYVFRLFSYFYTL